MSWLNLRDGEVEEVFEQDNDDIAEARLDWDSDGEFGEGHEDYEGPEDDE